jgi:thiamine-phosphate pyrophosphorylase
MSERTLEPSRVPSTTSLYLDFVVADEAPDRALSILAAALDAAPIASVLIRPASEAVELASARSLISAIQAKNIATLLSATPAVAANLRADGIHLPWSTDIVRDFKEARRSATGEMMIGADAGRSRHEAMGLGEAGADYIAFGIPPHVGDRERAAERQLDLISWWSELFEVPCVAFDVPDSEAARRLAEAGADFVSVRLTDGDVVADAIARVREFSQALQVHETAK